MTIDEKENRCKTSGTVILGKEEVFPSFSRNVEMGFEAIYSRYLFLSTTMIQIYIDIIQHLPKL